jgi:hypothetical protein
MIEFYRWRVAYKPEWLQLMSASSNLLLLADRRLIALAYWLQNNGGRRERFSLEFQAASFPRNIIWLIG